MQTEWDSVETNGAWAWRDLATTYGMSAADVIPQLYVPPGQ